MRNHYRNKRDKLLHAIEISPLASYVTIFEEDAGLHFLLKINTKLSDREFLLKMEQKGIKLSSLSQYFQTSPKEVEHIFIINYSFVTEENMEKAIRMIYHALL